MTDMQKTEPTQAYRKKFWTSDMEAIIAIMVVLLILCMLIMEGCGTKEESGETKEWTSEKIAAIKEDAVRPQKEMEKPAGSAFRRGRG